MSVGKAVAGSGFKAACEPPAQAAGAWGEGGGARREQTFAYTPQGPFCPCRRPPPPVSHAVSASKKSNQKEKEREKFFQPHPI